ncbi:hypothetical protein CBR_g57840 [Chara braunii]|uniref:Uncharacterized protein n=1 Tax=Chara braunii TaxID=69332 RepID=A0A388K866_CHABU|nr:hypothetical protein CBR_g57840 [Chara braunii]|eukprot:GBG66237.1 hypothetical protein CBR_g57840 [Chara braunii]
MLRKEKAEEFSEYAAFRYAEKKRARDQGTEDKDKTIPTTKEEFLDLRPKARKVGKNQKRKESNKEQTEMEEESERTLPEKEAAIVLSQTEKLKRWNKECSPEFTTITQIAGGQVPMVVESAKTARRTLRNIRPLTAARYVAKTREWQIATDVSFKIPHFVEGMNVIKELKRRITMESPLGLYETVAMDESQMDICTQEDAEGTQKSAGETNRTSPRAFSPLIAKMPESTVLNSGMFWKSWRTVAEVPYSILTDLGMSAELMATAVAHIISTRLLEGDEDLEARAFLTDSERFYRSEASDDELWNVDDEREKPDWFSELERDINGKTGMSGSNTPGTELPSLSDDSGLKIYQETTVEDGSVDSPPPLPT